jgi:hypothetical protein
VGLEPTTNGLKERGFAATPTVGAAHADVLIGGAVCAAYSRAWLAVSFAVIKSITHRGAVLEDPGA